MVAVAANALALWPWQDIGTRGHAPLVQVRVIDGDTLHTRDERIRLIGIDAPERLQSCRDAQGREWQCGQAAKKRLMELVARGGITCTPHGRDSYGRTLAVCSASDIPDLGERLVTEGLAVNYARDFGEYVAAEIQARFARRGLWQGEFERPQDWRRRHPHTS